MHYDATAHYNSLPRALIMRIGLFCVLLWWLTCLCLPFAAAGANQQPAANQPAAVFCPQCMTRPEDLFRLLFARLDLDQDQKISREEYMTYEQEIFHFRDLDQDGTLDEREFIYKRMPVQPYKNRPYIRNSTLEKLHDLGNKRSGRQRVFTPVDRNANGSVSYSEYRQDADDRFFRLDTDSDRHLSLDEFLQAFYHVRF